MHLRDKFDPNVKWSDICRPIRTILFSFRPSPFSATDSGVSVSRIGLTFGKEKGTQSNPLILLFSTLWLAIRRFSVRVTGERSPPQIRVSFFGGFQALASICGLAFADAERSLRAGSRELTKTETDALGGYTVGLRETRQIPPGDVWSEAENAKFCI